MRIICTVKELADIIRGCAEYRRCNATCSRCPFVDVCEDGFIEQFIAAGDVVEEEQDDENA